MRDGSDEPEVQHLDECEHPVAPCTCPRDHLLDEARRIRDMCLFAEAEFARENRRAVDLKAERDRLATIADRLYRRLIQRDVADETAAALAADVSLEELIEASSLGSPEAKAMRDQTPDGVVEEVMDRIKRQHDD
jgi:hypothetical protein